MGNLLAKAIRWIEPGFVDGFGRRLGDLFDIHSALSRSHDQNRVLLPVNEDCKIVLVSNVTTRLHVQVADNLPRRTSLLGYQPVTKDI